MWLGRRAGDEADHFPLGEEWADLVCGATHKPRAAVRDQLGLVEAHRTGSRQGEVLPTTVSLAEPVLAGPLAALAEARHQAEAAAAGHEAELARARRETEYWRRRAVGWRAARKVAGWFGLAGNGRP